MRALHWWSLAFLALAVAAFARYFLARQESAALQAEIGLLEHENREIAKLRAEHERLVAARVSDAELERLRSDRAALGRLRAEINTLEESADRKARTAQEPRPEPPALVLNVGLASNGGLLLDSAAADQAALRQLFANLARRSERVEIRLRVPSNETPVELVKATVEWLARTAREVGLPMSLRFEKPGQPQPK